MRALNSVVLPLARLRRFERMVFRYKQVYRHFASGGASKVEYREIERLQREKKNHRGVDFELKLVDGKVTGMADFLA